MKLRNEPGWFGAFTREHVEGAIPNGTCIEKVCFEAGDSHPIGTLGTVLGSARPPVPLDNYEHVKCFYFVEWYGRPYVACGVLDYKIRPKE